MIRHGIVAFSVSEGVLYVELCCIKFKDGYFLTEDSGKPLAKRFYFSSEKEELLYKLNKAAEELENEDEEDIDDDEDEDELSKHSNWNNIDIEKESYRNKNINITIYDFLCKLLLKKYRQTGETISGYGLAY